MSARADYDVVVVGAGVAGLAAVNVLVRAGCRALCVEARDRVGGRIFTQHDALSALPIELGAEFVHGRPPEIWDLARTANLLLYDCADASVRVRDGEVQRQEDAWLPVGELMREMRAAAATGEDEPFASFVARSGHGEEAKELSTSFVEGFNAARKEVVGIASLAKDAAAADEIDGDRSFRIANGYDRIPLYLASQVREELRLNTVVRGIDWSPGFVTIHTGQGRQITADKVVVTVPLGVMEDIEWRPLPARTIEAARKLAFGQVMRVVLRFREAFWEEQSDFSDAGFVLSNEAVFSTWWTPLAVRAPILTGWSAGPHADVLLGLKREEIIGKAVETLGRIFGKRCEPEAAYFHNWHADPFARGAYSYVPAGALSAREALAEPVEGTLYFAGEATELNGHSATVHGAMASGRRAARAIVGC